MYHLTSAVHTNRISQIIARLANCSIVSYEYSGPQTTVGSLKLVPNSTIGINSLGDIVIHGTVYPMTPKQLDVIKKYLVRVK